MNEFLMLAMGEPSTVVKEVVEGVNATAASGDSWWKSVALVTLGVILTKVVGWIAGWIDGKGAAFVQERLLKLQEKVNSNETMAQIHADDAVFKILHDGIPEVMNAASETVKKNLKEGRFDKADWKELGSNLWAASKEQILGGAKDYLKESSFNDGELLAAWVLKKVFNKKKAKAEGLIDD